MPFPYSPGYREQLISALEDSKASQREKLLLIDFYDDNYRYKKKGWRYFKRTYFGGVFLWMIWIVNYLSSEGLMLLLGEILIGLIVGSIVSVIPSFFIGLLLMGGAKNNIENMKAYKKWYEQWKLNNDHLFEDDEVNLITEEINNNKTSIPLNSSGRPDFGKIPFNEKNFEKVWNFYSEEYKKGL